MNNKVLKKPHLPVISQNASKGISNIFIPQIMIRKKTSGGMSYNHNRDMDEQLPEIKFKTGDQQGQIIDQHQQPERNWQTPQHNLWQTDPIYGGGHHNPAYGGGGDPYYNSDYLYASQPHYEPYENDKNLKGPYYWDEKSQKVTDKKSGKPIYWNVNKREWIDKNSETVEGFSSKKKAKILRSKKEPYNNSKKDPLNTMASNMKKEKQFREDDKKSCGSYIQKYGDTDEEQFISEARKNNTWKKFNPDYHMVDPIKWDVPKKRPPVCIPERVNLPSAVFTQGTPTNVLEFDRYGKMASSESDVTETNVGSILPKFVYKELRDV